MLSLPPGINQTYKTTRSGGFYKSEKAKEWETQAGWEIKKVKRYPIDSTCQVGVDIILVLDRDRDIDSCTKIVFDLLQKQGVIANDSQIIRATQEKYLVKKGIMKPHLKVRVTEV